MDRWSDLLDRYKPRAHECLFVTAPNVVGDTEATADLFACWWSAPLRRGYTVAYVAQLGIRCLNHPARAAFLGVLYPH